MTQPTLALVNKETGALYELVGHASGEGVDCEWKEFTVYRDQCNGRLFVRSRASYLENMEPKFSFLSMIKQMSAPFSLSLLWMLVVYVFWSRANGHATIMSDILGLMLIGCSIRYGAIMLIWIKAQLITMKPQLKERQPFGVANYLLMITCFGFCGFFVFCLFKGWI